MTEARLGGVRFAGMDAMKTDGYLVTADGGEGTIVVCPCVDLTTSTGSEDGRFVHDYQSEYGSPPGVYAAEGWDAGGMLVEAFGAGAVDRAEVARAIGSMATFDGLANTYRFDPGGGLDQGIDGDPCVRGPRGEVGAGGRRAAARPRFRLGRRATSRWALSHRTSVRLRR